MELKEFLIELRNSINAASNALMESNIKLLDQYFENKTNSNTGESIRVAKTIRMDYPIVLENGTTEMKRIDVPSIALIPVTNSKLGKVSFSFDCTLEDNNGDIIVHFPKDGKFNKEKSSCHMDFTIVPDDPTEGMKAIIDSYSELIEKQIDD